MLDAIHALRIQSQGHNASADPELLTVSMAQAKRAGERRCAHEDEDLKAL